MLRSKNKKCNFNKNNNKFKINKTWIVLKNNLIKICKLPSNNSNNKNNFSKLKNKNNNFKPQEINSN